MRHVKNISSCVRSQRGYTLIEILVVVAITGAISGVISMVILSMMDVVTQSRSHIDAIAQAQNAERWMERDGKMCQIVEVERKQPNQSGTMQMVWSDWGGTRTEVIYFLQDNQLRRRESTFSVDTYNPFTQQWDGAPIEIFETLIAVDVVSGSPQTSFSLTTERVIQIDITVENQTSTRGVTQEKRHFEINPRAIW